jgi:hypothetical protein
VRALASAVAAVVMAAASGLAQAAGAITELEWDAQQRFERTLTVEPRGFVELCGRLKRGIVVQWQ